MGMGRLERRRVVQAALGTAVALVATMLAPEAAQAQAARFQLERNGEAVGLFDGCRGLGSENEVIEAKVIGPGGVEVVRKLPGRLRFLDVVCTRGASASTALSEWRALVELGNVADARSAVTVTELDAQGKPARSWRLLNAWPVELQVVGGAGGSVELVRIAHEGLVRDQ